MLERKDNTVLKLYKVLHPFLMLEFGGLRVSPVQKADMSNQSSGLGTVTAVRRDGQLKQYSKITINLIHTRRSLRLLFRTTLKITQLEDEVWMVQKMQLCKPPCGSSLRIQTARLPLMPLHGGV